MAGVRPHLLPSTTVLVCALTAAALAETLAAQTKPPPPTAAATREAVEAWLTSPLTDEALLDKTVAVVLAGEDGIGIVGRTLAAATDAAEQRTKGVQALATHVALDFVRLQVKSKMRFVGQFEPLRPLQPYVGRLFTMLLFETPPWYPETQRIELVPALRDLFPASPGEAAINGAIEIVKNTEIEPEDLRTSLACALHQWGRPQYVQPKLEQLLAASAEGSAEDRVPALRELAELRVELRQWRTAAANWDAMLVLAVKTGAEVRPLDWYGAACAHCLAGNRDRALECLEACAALQTSGIDPSVKIERRLLEQDPDLASVRGTERFNKMLAKAFPGDSGAGDKGK